MKRASLSTVMSTVVIGLSVSFTAQAQVEGPQIDELLGIMQRHVREKKLREIPGARLGVDAIDRLKLSGRPYRAGEAWAVEFRPSADPGAAAMVRKTTDLRTGEGATAPHIYDFRVLALLPDGAARISVTQRLAAGQVRADNHVDHVVLVVSPAFVPVKKEIYYRDGRQPLALVLGERGNTALGFDAAPTDLPNLGTGNGVPVHRAGERAGLEFRSVDIYARPVTAVWHEGEVWPSVVKTASGTSTLIK